MMVSISSTESEILTEHSQKSHVGIPENLCTYSMYHSLYFQLVAVAALFKLTWKDFDKDFIIYAFRVLNIEIFLKLPCLQIRFKIQFIAGENGVKTQLSLREYTDEILKIHLIFKISI